MSFLVSCFLGILYFCVTILALISVFTKVYEVCDGGDWPQK